MEKKVNILLSTYNGEKYIGRQLKSLQKQSYNDFKLYIRDDGSSDKTLEIIQSYREKMDIEIIEGNNIGFLKSFKFLLEYADKGEYWAFCDQDDWWHEDKIKYAIGWLEEQNEKIPLLYHNAYEIIDEKTKEKEVFYFGEDGYNFIRSITENHFSGFSMVINKNLRDKMLQGNWDYIDYHDWWAAMIVTAFGKYKFDKRVLAKHYRNSESVTLITYVSRIKWFYKMLHEKSAIKKRAEEFEHIFGRRLEQKKKKELDLFITKEYDLVKSVKKAFYPFRWRPNLSSEMAIRILMFLGKI